MITTLDASNNTLMDSATPEREDCADGKRIIRSLTYGMCFGDFLILNVAALFPTYCE